MTYGYFGSTCENNNDINRLNMREGIRAALPNTVALGSLHFAPAANEVSPSSSRKGHRASSYGHSRLPLHDWLWDIATLGGYGHRNQC